MVPLLRNLPYKSGNQHYIIQISGTMGRLYLKYITVEEILLKKNALKLGGFVKIIFMCLFVKKNIVFPCELYFSCT